MFVVLKGVTCDGSKINRLEAWDCGDESVSIVRQYTYRHEIAYMFLRRVLRYQSMLIDDYNNLADRVMRRYRSPHDGSVQGCLSVGLNKYGMPEGYRIYRKDKYLDFVNTAGIRFETRKKYKKRDKDFQDTQVLLAELKYINEISKHEALTWETKLQKLERLETFGN